MGAVTFVRRTDEYRAEPREADEMAILLPQSPVSKRCVLPADRAVSRYASTHLN